MSGQKQIPVTSLSFTPDSVMPVSLEHVPPQITVGTSRQEEAELARMAKQVVSITATPSSHPVAATGGLCAGSNSEVGNQVKEAIIQAFGDSEWQPAALIICRESGFNAQAVNVHSGAGGLFQALPFSKTGCALSDVSCQITWGISYFKNRYGTPSNAWAFWRTHNWY